MRRLTFQDERWPLANAFVIARGSKTEAHVVTVAVHEGAATGRGEAVPYARYGESVSGILEQIESLSKTVEAGVDRRTLQDLLPAGAARNAIDCALWDLEAKSAGVRAWTLAGLPEPKAVTTAFTLSLGSAESMAEAARDAAHRPLLKLKIGGADDLDGGGGAPRRAFVPADRRRQ